MTSYSYDSFYWLLPFESFSFLKCGPANSRLVSSIQSSLSKEQRFFHINRFKKIETLKSCRSRKDNIWPILCKISPWDHEMLQWWREEGSFLAAYDHDAISKYHWNLSHSALGWCCVCRQVMISIWHRWRRCTLDIMLVSSLLLH